MVNLRKILMLVALLVMPPLASAGIIYGTPTANNSTTPVGLVNGSNEVTYFIPLVDTVPGPGVGGGVYGVDNGGSYGTTPDSNSIPLGGDILQMYLYFDIDEGNEVGTSASFWFEDLDLRSTNDPTGFFETFNGIETWTELGAIPNLTFDSAYNFGSSTTNNVSFTISNLNITQDTWLSLAFTSYNGSGLCATCTYTNTAERLSVSLTTVAVPEPEILFLFGLGLIGLGFARRKISH